MAVLDVLTVGRSGSVGDRVHARNPFGPYTRNRTTPNNPNTARQIRARGRFRDVAKFWTEDLTNAERSTWKDFATRVTVPSRDGGYHHLTGQNLFIRNNAGRSRTFMGIIRDAPNGPNNGTYSLPEVQTIIGVGLILIIYGTTDEWIRDDGAFMQCYVSDTQTPDTNFFAAPFRFAGATPGDAANPPISGDTYFDPFPIVPAGPRWARTRVVFGDGRCTQSRILRFTTP